MGFTGRGEGVDAAALAQEVLVRQPGDEPHQRREHVDQGQAAGDPARLAEYQLALLKRGAEVLRPGGVLVYSTCTLPPEENEAIVTSFLKSSKEYALTARAQLPEEVGGALESDGTLHCYPHVHDSDGFFAARLERRS